MREGGTGEKENILFGTQALDPRYPLEGKAICFFGVICFIYEHIAVRHKTIPFHRCPVYYGTVSYCASTFS